MKIRVTTPTNEEVSRMDFSNWGTWECEVSQFPWTYDSEETCYMLDGHVIVKTDEEEVEFRKGDLVTFPRGLRCHWNVLEPVKKYYKFS